MKRGIPYSKKFKVWYWTSWSVHIINHSGLYSAIHFHRLWRGCGFGVCGLGATDCCMGNVDIENDGISVKVTEADHLVIWNSWPWD